MPSYAHWSGSNATLLVANNELVNCIFIIAWRLLITEQAAFPIIHGGPAEYSALLKDAEYSALLKDAEESSPSEAGTELRETNNNYNT